MSRLMGLVARYWVPLTMALSLAIIVLSLWPVPALPPVPGTDKLHHFVAYGALVVPAALSRTRHLWLLVLAFLIGSGLIELVQPLVNRYGEWADLAANATGLLCGLLLARALIWAGNRSGAGSSSSQV